MRKPLGGRASLGWTVLWGVLAIVVSSGDAGAGPDENTVVVAPFAQNVAGFQTTHLVTNTRNVPAVGGRFCLNPSGALLQQTMFTVLPNTTQELPLTGVTGLGMCIYDASSPISAAVLAGIPAPGGSVSAPGTQLLMGIPGRGTVGTGHGGSYWWTTSGPGWNSFAMVSNPTVATQTVNMFQFSPDASQVIPTLLNLGPGQTAFVHFPSLGGSRGAVEYNVTGAGGVVALHVFLGTSQAILKEVAGDAFSESILTGGAYE